VEYYVKMGFAIDYMCVLAVNVSFFNMKDGKEKGGKQGKIIRKLI
jgi:hypothetical protein